MTSKKAPGPAGNSGNPGFTEAVTTDSIVASHDGKPDPDLLTDAEWTTHVDAAHGKAEGAMRKTLVSMREAIGWAVYLGRCLSEAKQNRCKHGEWETWIAAHCNVSQRTATRYMRVSRSLTNVGESKWPRAANLSLRQLEALLAEPKPLEKPTADDRPTPRLTLPADSAVLDAPVRLRKEVSERAVALASKRDGSGMVTVSDVKHATRDALLADATKKRGGRTNIPRDEIERIASDARVRFATVLRNLHAVRAEALDLCRSELGAFVGT